MADADEEYLIANTPPLPHLRSRPNSNPAADAQDDDDDDADETLLDYAHLSPSLPRRGLKDFEPTALSSQISALDSSRLALDAALAYPRVHNIGGKGHVLGVYVPEEEGEGEDCRREDGRCVRIDEFRSSYSRSMGVAGKGNRFWLHGEEGLWLLETGRLDLRWPELKEGLQEQGEVGGVDEGNDDQEKEEEEDHNVRASELPMSLQGAYASFVGKHGLTLERYIVYAGLKRSGYTVMRAPTWLDDDIGVNGYTRPHSLPIEVAQMVNPSSGFVGSVSALIHRLVRYLFQPDQNKACPSLGPLLAPGLYRSYNDIFRALTLVQCHEPTSKMQTTHPKPPFRIAYHVWKPNSNYRKSMPPPPDFRIVVVDARSTSVPRLDQIGALLDSMPSDELPAEKRFEQRLKHGKRNVILAVVDTGIVSYIRLSDACFGGIKLFEQPKRQGGKGGPRGAKKGK